MTVRTCVTCAYKRRDLCTKQWSEVPGEQVNLVTGAVTRTEGRHFSCETQRKYTFNSCGAKGVWWTPIKTAKERANDPTQRNIFERAILRMLRVFS